MADITDVTVLPKYMVANPVLAAFPQAGGLCLFLVDIEEKVTISICLCISQGWYEW